MKRRSASGPIITGIMDNGWDEMLKYGKKRTYPANYTLMHPGEKLDSLYYIDTGEVVITSYSSPEQINRLFILREKTILGLIALFIPNQPVCSWVTLKPCTLYVFTKEEIYTRAPREFLLKMLEQLAVMSSYVSRRATAGSMKHIDILLARLLIHLVNTCQRSHENKNKNVIILIPNITQEMASDLLGIHPVTFNKLLAAFRKEGIVGKFSKNKLEILNLIALQTKANGTDATKEP